MVLLTPYYVIASHHTSTRVHELQGHYLALNLVRYLNRASFIHPDAFRTRSFGEASLLPKNCNS